MPKINWKKSLYHFIWILIICLLVYSRFINLGWGLPYPMHPDERNMAVAVQGLNCKISNFEFRISNFRECGNPHFFAYGQFPLYLGYGGVQIMKLLGGDLGSPISFQEALISLRIISATASILSVFVLLEILKTLIAQDGKKRFPILYGLFSILIFIFSPALIQFSHFGTTESLLILFYLLTIYYSLLFLQNKIRNSKFLIINSLFCGLALATKVSAVLYLVIPIVVFLFQLRKKCINNIRSFLFLTLVFFIIFSPHILISFQEFSSSMQYESDVALGQVKVFYTRQFDHTMPIIFQMTKILPYALGWPVFILGIIGILGLSWKKKEFNLLRLSLLLILIPNSFMYAKWTRFIAQVFPIMILFSILFLFKLRIHRFLFYLLCFVMIVPGIAFLSIYVNADSRFQASDWIYKNIPNESIILSETANVVDIPLDISRYRGNKVYKIISFNFYDLDTDKKIQNDFLNILPNTDYIFVPSRRIFANHPQEKYPILNEYYQKLFSGTLGFKQIAEFTSYPRINFQFSIFNFHWELPDENAEETWTVFDHPVIRIYKRESTFFR